MDFAGATSNETSVSALTPGKLLEIVSNLSRGVMFHLSGWMEMPGLVGTSLSIDHLAVLASSISTARTSTPWP